jgi:hypothetical protein
MKKFDAEWWEKEVQKAASQLTKMTRLKDFKRGFMEDEYYCMEFIDGQVFKVKGNVLDKMILRMG